MYVISCGLRGQSSPGLLDVGLSSPPLLSSGRDKDPGPAQARPRTENWFNKHCWVGQSPVSALVPWISAI